MVRIGVCSVEPSGSATGVSVNLLVGCISSFMVWEERSLQEILQGESYLYLVEKVQGNDYMKWK
jgi:hypothetical protein